MVGAKEEEHRASSSRHPGTIKGRKEALDLGICDISQNVKILALVEGQMKQIEHELQKR
ncbi:MAG: hypothetical protein QMC89_03840 [Candidatus Hodarchaeaceae archaeon]|nr:hypothetical protein [Candidatus Hodarchaeaceae archaeon]